MPRGSSETRAKTSHNTAYSAVVGPISEMVFSAIGMKAPGFASVAPAAKTAIQGEEATAVILSTMPFVVFSPNGFR